MFSTDPLEGGEQPRCDSCGTVMRNIDGGYECGGCGWFQDVPWIERPTGGDDFRASRAPDRALAEDSPGDEAVNPPDVDALRQLHFDPPSPRP